MRLSIVGQMVTCSGIVAMAGLLYIDLHKQNKIIALIALGLWLAEAILLAISQLGILALLPVSLDFVQAGALQHSSYLPLGTFLYNGVYSYGITIHMWFYCLGEYCGIPCFIHQSISHVLSLSGAFWQCL